MAYSRAITRYVKSLLGLAEERGILDKVHKDMLLFKMVCVQNRAFRVMLRSPVIRHDKKLQVLTKIFEGKVESLTMAFFEIITKKNREPLLSGIASEFHDAYNEFSGICKATVTTTFSIDDQLREEIGNIVKKISDKKKIELVEKIDSEMIGGFVLSVGDRQLDASLKNKLKNLATKFSENPYIKEY